MIWKLLRSMLYRPYECELESFLRRTEERS